MTTLRLTGRITKLAIEGVQVEASLTFNESNSKLFDEVKILLSPNDDLRLGQEFIAEVQFVRPE